MNPSSYEIETQRQYYTETAGRYEEMHMQPGDEHYMALALMVASIDFLRARSILDIGSGTGRALRHVRSFRPDIRIIGVEPVDALREVGYSQGLSQSELIAGDATDLAFESGEFDLVCEYGVLHHIPRPERAVSEMLRVAKRAIFISDSNNFGQGSRAARSAKQLINALGLWGVADYVKTRGKGYTVSDGDGLAYSYSVFNNYRQIAKACQSVHILNTQNSNGNLYRNAGHVALLGIK